MVKEINKKKRLEGLKGRVQNSLSGFLRACIVALLVLFQFSLIIILPFFLREYFSIVYFISSLFVIKSSLL